jgi:hypothetical protein
MSEEKPVEAVETPEGEIVDDASIEATWTDLAAARKDSATAPLSGAEAKEKPEAIEAPKVEAPVDPTASQAASDPWKDAPPELREAHERELAEIRTRAESAETLAKRHSGRLSQANQRLSELQAKLEPERTGEQAEAEASTREERRRQLREEYPDSAGPLLDEVAALETEIAQIKATVGQKAEADTDNLIAEQEKILTEAHPDWRTQVKDNPAFVEWALKQPEYVLEPIRQNAKQIVSGADIADVISRYKADTAPKVDPEKEKEEQRRQEQLEAGRDPSLRKPGMTATSSDDPDAIWSELAAKRQRAAGK